MMITLIEQLKCSMYFAFPDKYNFNTPVEEALYTLFLKNLPAEIKPQDIDLEAIQIEMIKNVNKPLPGLEFIQADRVGMPETRPSAAPTAMTAPTATTAIAQVPLAPVLAPGSAIAPVSASTVYNFAQGCNVVINMVAPT